MALATNYTAEARAHPVASQPTTTSLLQAVTLSNVVAALALYILGSVVLASLRKPKYPQSLPWVGVKEGDGWLGGWKAALTSVMYVRSWAQEGYEKVRREK